MHILFDIDHTLVVHEKYVHRKYSHLTKINNYYAINLKKTSNLFKYLLKRGIKIGFLTAASYTRNPWLKIFEKIYKLKKGSLKNSVFINGHDYGKRSTPKGVKINKLIEDELIRGKIILVDDKKRHVKSAIDCGHFGILANGFPVSRKMDNYYLVEIKRHANLS